MARSTPRVKYRPNPEPKPAPPAPVVEMTLVADAAQIRDGSEEIRVGSGVAIRYDLGPRGNRYDNKRPDDRLWVRGLGSMSETVAIELALEILTGVVELRRLHADPDPDNPQTRPGYGPLDPDDVTKGDHGIRLSIATLGEVSG